jgi:hypothetical protein
MIQSPFRSTGGLGPGQKENEESRGDDRNAREGGEVFRWKTPVIVDLGESGPAIGALPGYDNLDWWLEIESGDPPPRRGRHMGQVRGARSVKNAGHR